MYLFVVGVVFLPTSYTKQQQGESEHVVGFTDDIVLTLASSTSKGFCKVVFSHFAPEEWRKVLIFMPRKMGVNDLLDILLADVSP